MTHADWQRDVPSGIYMRSTRNQIKFFPESSHDDSNAGWPWTCPDLHYCHQRLAVLSSVPCIPSVYLLSPLSTIWHIHWQHCTLVSVSLFVLYTLTSVCAVYSPLSLYSLFIIVLFVPFLWMLFGHVHGCFPAFLSWWDHITVTTITDPVGFCGPSCSPI